MQEEPRPEPLSGSPNGAKGPSSAPPSPSSGRRPPPSSSSACLLQAAHRKGRDRMPMAHTHGHAVQRELSMDFKLIRGRQPPARVQQDVVELEEPGQVRLRRTGSPEPAAAQPASSESCRAAARPQPLLLPPRWPMTPTGPPVTLKAGGSRHLPGKTCAAGVPCRRAC